MINESLTIKIDDVEFEGPLDLLIHLVYKNELNIFDLPISEVTMFFVEEIRNMREMDIEVAAEFIYMATFLIYLKSRMLLPRDSVDDEDLDPEEAKLLFNQLLIEYSFYKDMAMELRVFEKSSGNFLARSDSLLILKEDILVEDSFRLPESYFAPPKSKREKEMVVRNSKIAVEEISRFMKSFILSKNKLLWDEIAEQCNHKVEKCISFSTVLELIKAKSVTAFQEENFSSILLRVIRELDISDAR